MGHEDLLAVIRPAHWIEIAEFLGQNPVRAKENLGLYLKILDLQGYVLRRKGESAPTNEKAVPVPPVPTVDRARIYDAIEGAIMDTTARRMAGERISDQAEIRAIQAAVEAVHEGQTTWV